MTGGKKWRAGADTCVFKPQVACKDNSTPIELRGEGYVSRVVKKGLEDQATEEFIRTHFPDLVKAGIINVQLHSCTPKFRSSNLQYAEDRRPGNIPTCGPIDSSNEDDYINMITKEYGGGDFDTRKKIMSKFL